MIIDTIVLHYFMKLYEICDKYFYSYKTAVSTIAASNHDFGSI